MIKTALGDPAVLTDLIDADVIVTVLLPHAHGSLYQLVLHDFIILFS
jgi:hypothetical protein